MSIGVQRAMTLKTELTRRLGIRLPILAGGPRSD